MNDSIIHKINTLGGVTDAVNPDKTFTENWQSIRFNNYLYDKDWDIYGIDEFYRNHAALYKENNEKFYNDLTEHYFSLHDRTYGQYFFKDWMFTPFKPGSEDYEELEGLVEEND